MVESVFVVGIIELGNVWMLGWLAAAGIPLALHLLHRRRQQEMQWAAMELLQQAIRQNSRTVRIEQWLLLLLRICALILFAVALARPLQRSTGGSESTKALPPKLWVLVMDASYSMQYVPQRQSLWEMAQQRALELIDRAQAGDAFLVVELAEPSRSLITRPAFDAPRVVEELRRMTCGDGGGDLPSCLELVRQSIEEAKQSAPQHQDVHIVFFTDLGRDTWHAAVDRAARSTLEQLATRHQVQIESLAPPAQANVAVTAFTGESSVLLKGRQWHGSATVENFSLQELKDFPIQFQSEGKTLHTEFIDCPPGDSRSITVELPPPQSRYWNVSAVIPNDKLAIDNRRDLIVSARPQVRVITIEENTGAARWISLSLAPSTQSTNASTPIAVDSATIGELPTLALANWDAVILVDVTEITEATIVKLTNYVEQGGALFALIGPATRMEAWNRRDQSAGQVFGFDLLQASPYGDWRIDPLNYASPIAKPFANFQDAGLLTTPIFRYWRIARRNAAASGPMSNVSTESMTELGKTSTNEPLHVDLAILDGDPFLVRRPLGSGWTAAMLSVPQSGQATDAVPETSWNAIATWPSFVPIMQTTIETLIGGTEPAMNLNVGEPLRGSVGRQTQAWQLDVRRPDDAMSRTTVPADSEGNQQPWLYTASDRAGVYRVWAEPDESSDSNRSSSGRPYAVNIVPSQSDLKRVSIANLPLNGESVRAELATMQSNDASGKRSYQEQISRWCLTVLLVVLTAESLLAWNLGRRLA